MLQAGPARWKPGAQGASAFPPAASEHGVDITCNEHRGHGAHTKRATDTAAHPSSVSINPGPGGRPQHTTSLGSHGGPPSSQLILQPRLACLPSWRHGRGVSPRGFPGARAQHHGDAHVGTSAFPSKGRPRVGGLDRAGGSLLLLNLLQPRLLTKDQRVLPGSPGGPGVRSHLPSRRHGFQPWAGGDPTCPGAAKRVALEPVVRSKRSRHNEKPLLAATEKAQAATKTQHGQNKKHRTPTHRDQGCN